MPFVRITISEAALAPGQISSLQSEMTELMALVLGKRADLTSVLVEQPAAAGWAIGGTPVPVAAHVDATITAGTNSPEQKASFIDETMRLLRRVVGTELHPATYVVVTEVPGNSWGYDGRTQDSRKESQKESQLAV
jgi:4-oxalocrotonate tautomerase